MAQKSQGSREDWRVGTSGGCTSVGNHSGESPQYGIGILGTLKAGMPKGKAIVWKI